MKKCLVIGGGSDIGASIVKTMHKSGYEVYWTFFNTERRDMPSKGIKCDLRNQENIRGVFRKFSSIDVLVMAAFPFFEDDNLDFDGYIKAEKFLRGHILSMILASEKMNNGKIFNILGQCVERGLPGGAFYSGSFAFLHNFGNSINAREGKQSKVSVCDLLLGPVDTREWNGLSEEVINRYKSKVKDFINPQQVADSVAFFSEQPILPSTFKLDAYYGY